VQFTANPWLPDYMSDALALLTRDAGDDVGEVAGRLASYVRNRGLPASDASASGIVGLVRAVQSEPQRNALDQLLVLGTLLEGHAEHVMDAVGPKAVPSVATIRGRFDDRRRRKPPPLQRLMRALLGLDAKLSQYTRGKAFVDHVVDRVGMQRFSTVWTSSETLPLPAEIEDPQRWIDRIL
ncbi:zinc-dependent metalloprotease, partial [Mycobacterium montefiorense]